MKKLLTILLILSLGHCYTQTTNHIKKSDSVLFDELLDHEKRIDSLQHLLYSLSKVDDSIFQVIMYESLNKTEVNCLKEKIKGEWTSLGTKDKLLKFNSDSVIYLDQLETYFYRINNREVIVFLESTNDTLKFFEISSELYILENRNKNENYKKNKIK